MTLSMQYMLAHHYILIHSKRLKNDSREEEAIMNISGITMKPDTVEQAKNAGFDRSEIK